MPTRTLPHPNSYWLPDNLPICAGEYPYAPDAKTGRAKLVSYLDAGLTYFLDLTEAHELDHYEAALYELAAERGLAVEYRRLPVRDNDVPSVERMREILDAMDQAGAAGHHVYVHCWGGVGRTGTVVGAYLVRQGITSDEALARVQALFETMSPEKVRRHRWTGSPQVESQRQLVRGWTESPQGSGASVPDAARRDRLRGALIGLAVGDAVGATVEFKPRGSFAPVIDMVGGGPFHLEPGQWTDDTSMALCLAESLVECGGFDALDQMQRYVRWWRDGHLSSTGRCFDIGNATSAALRAFEKSGEPYAGSTDPWKAGNGSIMRLAPVVTFFAYDPVRALEAAAESSRTTHAAPVAVDACRYLAALLLGAFAGASKEELLSPFYSPVPGYWEAHLPVPEIAEIAAGSFRQKSKAEISGSGYAAHTLEAALWAFATTEDFRSGCLAVVNLGDDADSTGAVYGQIAGAYYGEQAIPPAWRQKLALDETVDRLAGALADRAE